jgi:hypothetical protein
MTSAASTPGSVAATASLIAEFVARAGALDRSGPPRTDVRRRRHP